MKYISLLRGINVSGQKKIKMVDLRALYEGLGFSDVVSYIQSGNVIFSSKMKDRKKLIEMIEEAILDAYGFEVPVLIRSHEEISSILDACPFPPGNIQEDGTKVLVSLLSSQVQGDDPGGIQRYVGDNERLELAGTEVYLYCGNGYGRSKLSNNLIEEKLRVRATTRNWKTMIKLLDMSAPS